MKDKNRNLPYHASSNPAPFSQLLPPFPLLHFLPMYVCTKRQEQIRSSSRTSSSVHSICRGAALDCFLAPRGVLEKGGKDGKRRRKREKQGGGKGRRRREDKEGEAGEGVRKEGESKEGSRKTSRWKGSRGGRGRGRRIRRRSKEKSSTNGSRKGDLEANIR